MWAGGLTKYSLPLANFLAWATYVHDPQDKSGYGNNREIRPVQHGACQPSPHKQHSHTHAHLHSDKLEQNEVPTCPNRHYIERQDSGLAW